MKRRNMDKTLQNAEPVDGFPPRNTTLERKKRWSESLIQALLFLAGIFSIFITLGIVYILGREAWLFFRLPQVNLFDFLTGTSWQPHIKQFGILPLATATLLTTGIAMLIAIPLGLTVAIYLSEYASQKTRKTIKPVLELLAGIPTIVYGYFALTFITPILREIFGRDVVDIYNTGSAGLVMGILILPLVVINAREAIRAVPRSLREASYGIGATRWQTVWYHVLPNAMPGILTGTILAISRAMGGMTKRSSNVGREVKR